MPDPIVKKVLGSLGQIVTETVEKTAKETMNIASGVITGQELVGDIKPLSEEAMAKAITEAIANRAKLVDAGKTQLAKFSWDKAAQETMAVYKSLC